MLPDVNAKGNSSSASRKAAIAELPFEQLSPENRQQVSTLLKSPSSIGGSPRWRASRSSPES